jgi:3-phenylpropionate/cinnamic acid dioxygenase small subunit
MDAMAELRPELQVLVDEAAIRKVLVRYARAIDRMDWDLLRSCYHEGAIDDHGLYKGEIEGFIVLLDEKLALDESTLHFLGNQEIEVDGDVALAETACIARHRRAATADAPASDYFGFLRYCDRFERRGGEWRIAHRVVVYEPGRIDDVGAEPPYTERHTQNIRRISPEGLLRPGA